MNNVIISIVGYVWIISIIYCMIQLVSRYKKSSLDGVTGYTPGLDLIVVLILGPILMIVDIIVRMINKMK